MPAPATTESLTALIGLMQPKVYRWALGFTADPDDADDVAQEAFVLMYRRLHQYRGEQSFDGWLYQVTRRVANQRQRTGRRRARLAALEDARRELRAYLTDPGARIDREQMIAIIMAHLELLPPRQRELFDLVDLQGHTPAEVADLTGRQCLDHPRQPLQGPRDDSRGAARRAPVDDRRMSDCRMVRTGVLMRDLEQLERDPMLAAHLTTCARCSADVALVRLATAATAEMLNGPATVGPPAGAGADGHRARDIVA